MLRSLVHLYLSFVQGDKYGSICILLHADIQLDQHQLFKMLSFSIVWFWLVKYQVSMSVSVYFWVFNSIQLIKMSVSVPKPCSF